MPLIATVSLVVTLFLLGVGLTILAYHEYSKRKRKEKAMKNIDKYRDHIIKDEVRMILRSFNGTNPYSDEYKKSQEDLDQEWDKSCELIEKIEKKFS